MIPLLLLLLAITALGIRWLIPRGERGFAYATSIAQWVVYGLIVVTVNSTMPFAGGGDDYNYYQLATGAGNLAEALDFFQIAQRMEQPGYPILLRLAALLTGDDLLALKFVNIAAAVLLANVYLRIGMELSGPTLGRTAACFVMLLTPLWTYFVFLLKDLPITLLQSVSILGAILVYKSGGRRGWLLAGAATLAVFPMRTFLAAINVTLLAAATALAVINRRRTAGSTPSSVGAVMISLGACFALFLVITNPSFAASLGVLEQTRLISAETMSQSANVMFAASGVQRALFPILYLVTETTGLQSLYTGAPLNDMTLRGLLALPWLFFFLPLLLVGLHSLFSRKGLSALLASPWAVLLLFCAAYFGVSWIVGDTTRWRLPDMPALATISAYGFLSLRPSARILLLALWAALLVAATLVFYSS